MSSSTVGPLCLLFFVLSQGVRDALFGNVFQSISFFLIAALAFGTSTLCCSTMTALLRPKDFRKLLMPPTQFVALNVTTAIAWLCFFFGLKHLEPAVVATLYNGVGPLAVVMFGALDWIKSENGFSKAEWVCYAGIAICLIALSFVVLTSRSGLPTSNPLTQGVALLSTVVGGVMITVSHIIAREFNKKGVGSYAVMGARFFLTFVVAIVVEAGAGQAAMWPPIDALALLALTAFVLITVPSFMLQLGVARVSPLSANVMRSLGPVFVFALQQFDRRLRFSGETLTCIIGFCVFAIVVSVLRWRIEASVCTDAT